jgi:hypothetical protein
LGIAIIYSDFIKKMTRELDRVRYDAPGGISLNRVQETLNRKKNTTATRHMVQKLEPEKPCPACQQEAELETLAMTTLVDLLTQDERLYNAFKDSEGLCLPHLRRALELVRDEKSFDTLVQITREKLVTLQAELDEFIRKHDYRFQHEKFDAEGDSWQRAITRVVGMLRPNPDKRKSK